MMLKVVTIVVEQMTCYLETDVVEECQLEPGLKNMVLWLISMLTNCNKEKLSVEE